MSSRFISELQSRVNSQMMIIDELRETNKRLKEGTEVAHLQQQIRELERKLRTSSSSLSVKDSSFPKEMLKRMKHLSVSWSRSWLANLGSNSKVSSRRCNKSK